jgi:hypothetical protein
MVQSLRKMKTLELIQCFMLLESLLIKHTLFLIEYFIECLKSVEKSTYRLLRQSILQNEILYH